MAKRSSNVRDSKRVEEDEVKLEDEAIDEPVEALQAEDEEFIRLVLVRDMKVNVTGPVTGMKYVFDGLGAELDVDVRDAEAMLSKHGNRACCGGTRPQIYFQEVV